MEKKKKKIIFPGPQKNIIFLTYFNMPNEYEDGTNNDGNEEGFEIVENLICKIF